MRTLRCSMKPLGGYLIPMFGVLFGAIVFEEAITHSVIYDLILILTDIVVSRLTKRVFGRQKHLCDHCGVLSGESEQVSTSHNRSISGHKLSNTTIQSTCILDTRIVILMSRLVYQRFTVNVLQKCCN